MNSVVVDNYSLDVIYFKHEQLSILTDTGSELNPDGVFFFKFKNIRRGALEKITSRYARDVLIYAKKGHQRNRRF